MPDPAVTDACLLVSCPSCRHEGRAPARYRGSEVKCPKCGVQFIAEEADASAGRVALDDGPFTLKRLGVSWPVYGEAPISRIVLFFPS